MNSCVLQSLQLQGSFEGMNQAQAKIKEKGQPGRPSAQLDRRGRAKPTLSNRILANGFTELQTKFISNVLINGGNTRQAAIDAGYAAKGAAQQASALMRLPQVKAEIEKRRGEVAIVSRYTIEDHARQLEEQRQLAIQDRQHTAAAKLLELQGKLRGFYTERLEITHRYEQMSDEELRIKIMALQQDQDGVWHHPLHHIEGEHG